MGSRNRLLAGLRARVLLSFLVLLMLSTAASVIVLREVLLSRIDDEAAAVLAEFRRSGIQPPERRAGGWRFGLP